MLPAKGARPITLLIGQTLRNVRLEPATVLTFSGGSQVVIETAVEGEALLGDVVHAASVSDAGELTLAFTSGTKLLVGVDAETESWAVTGPDGLLTVCLAGGELAAWGDG
ncbi:DUF6188 family protein [Actinoplanes solisilvae]|uniref:DUF6188 family protein n=1 Tax=Actinoplanes solisilvae TaxID=2486853 RepID=UPI000FD732EA|nr:DUF6188 family protein [Actinoplanes solisilvae]